MLSKYKQVDIKDFYMVMAATGFLINKMEYDLKGTTAYKQGLKKSGNMFLKELQKYEDMVVNADVKQDGVDTYKAMDEMNESYLLFEQCLKAIFLIPNDKQAQFSNILNEVILYLNNADNTSANLKNTLNILDNLTKPKRHDN